MNDTIVEKIKKLLRLKRGGTPDEIATALRMAQELAAKHGIDLGSVDENEEAPREQPLTHADATTASRLARECIYSALICKHFFNVEPLTQRTGWRVRKITFIGREWDIQIALYVYNFLVGHFRREWNTKRGRCRNRHAFMSGMFDGLARKLRERQPVEVNEAAVLRLDRALVLRRDYMKEHFGDTTEKSYESDSDALAARHAGFIAGQQTEVRPGVKAGAENKTPALPPPQQGQLLLA